MEPDAARRAGHLACQPQRGRPRHVDVAFRDVDGLGSRPYVPLQRRLPADRRSEARLGDRQPVGQGMGGDLARYRAAHPACPRHRRGDLGRSPAALPGAQRVRRGTYHTSPTRRSPTTRARTPACCASWPRYGAGDRRTPVEFAARRRHHAGRRIHARRGHERSETCLASGARDVPLRWSFSPVERGSTTRGSTRTRRITCIGRATCRSRRPRRMASRASLRCAGPGRSGPHIRRSGAAGSAAGCFAGSTPGGAASGADRVHSRRGRRRCGRLPCRGAQSHRAIDSAYQGFIEP